MPIIALLPQLIALLPTITTGVENIIAWIEQVRTAAQQSNDWTDEVELAYQNMLVSRASAPAYQPDAP